MAKNGKRPPAKPKSSGNLTYWLLALLVILLVGALFLLKKIQSNGQAPFRVPQVVGGKVANLTEASLNLEEALNQALTTCGVTDADVVNNATTEEADGAARWYRFEKEIKLPAKINIEKLQRSLQETVEAQQGRVWENQLEKKDQENILTFKAGLREQVTHYLVVGQLLSLLPLSSPPQVALIIDDVGNNRDIEKLAALEIPLTVAILPQLEYSAFSVAYAQKKKSFPSCICLSNLRTTPSGPAPA